MKIRGSSSLFSPLLIALALAGTSPCSARVLNVAKDPYIGAIAIDAATGQTIFEKNADATGYPASIVKLMDLLVILEKIEQGYASLSNTVAITAPMAGIGGRQVFLMEKEVFTVEQLMAAMVIHSANDAATALAIHVAGTKDGFVELMNKRARQLGMTATTFRTVHGLPPGKKDKDQTPDTSTPRDLALLARILVQRPDVLKYTSIRMKPFRTGSQPFNLENPNHHMLNEFEGCDGLKTGFFDAAGFSSVTTAQRNGRRVIAVVMGSKTRAGRDEEAKKILSKAFLELPPPKPVIANTAAKPEASPRKPLGWQHIAMAGGIGLAIVWAIAAFAMRRSRPTEF